MGNTKTDLEREMTLKTTKLRDAITFALAVGTTALAGTGIAFAQDTTPACATTTHQPNSKPPPSTASKSPARASVASTPKTPARSSPSTAKRSRRPASSPSATSCRNCRTSPAPRPIRPSTTAAVPVRSTIDLRGFGSQRTLVLINGRRVDPPGRHGRWRRRQRDPGLGRGAHRSADRRRVLGLRLRRRRRRRQLHHAQGLRGPAGLDRLRHFRSPGWPAPGWLVHLRPDRREGQHHRRRQLQQVRLDLLGRPRLLQGRDLPLRRRRHRRRFQPQSARPHQPAGRHPLRSLVTVAPPSPAIPGARTVHGSLADYRCYSGAARLVQLPGRQPDPDPAGAHQRVLPGQLPDDGRRQRVHRRSTTTRPRPTSRSRRCRSTPAPTPW